MKSNGTALLLSRAMVLGMLAAITVVGCKQPIGLPEEVGVASIEYRCTVPENLNHWTCPLFYHYYNGHYGRAPYPNGCPWIDTKYDEGERRILAYSIMQVPPITYWSTEPIVVTLHYYQCHGDGGHPITVVNMPHEPQYDPRIDENIPGVWEYIWYHRTDRPGDPEFGEIADFRFIPDGDWGSCPVEPEFAQYIINMAFNGGGEVYLGWVYPGYLDDADVRIWGNQYSPPEEYKGPYIRIGTPQ